MFFTATGVVTVVLMTCFLFRFSSAAEPDGSAELDRNRRCAPPELQVRLHQLMQNTKAGVDLGCPGERAGLLLRPAGLEPEVVQLFRHTMVAPGEGCREEQQQDRHGLLQDGEPAGGGIGGGWDL